MDAIISRMIVYNEKPIGFIRKINDNIVILESNSRNSIM